VTQKAPARPGINNTAPTSYRLVVDVARLFWHNIP
jgi:hypothetical protein